MLVNPDAQQCGPATCSVAVIMPAYNECEGIEKVAEEWHDVVSQIPGATLLILNDGSTDNTAVVLETLRGRLPRLELINKENSGHASTCLRGYAWAVEHGYEYVFQTDSDGQTVPDELKMVWANRRGYDFIFGQRGTRADGLRRVIVSRVLRLCIYAVSRQWIRDANVPFRLMKCAPLKPILPTIPEGFFLGNVLLTCQIARHHEIRWVPITFRPRLGGVPSVRFAGFAAKGIQFVKQLWQIQRGERGYQLAPTHKARRRPDKGKPCTSVRRVG